MKILKWLGGIILAILVIGIIVNMLAPASISTERSTTIKAPANMVYNMVNDLKAWDDWSPWLAMDTTMVNTYGDVSVGKGATVAWKSTSQGNGSQEIVETVIGEKIKTKMNFEGFEGDNYSSWAFAESDGETKVSWDFEGAKSPWLFKWMNFMIKPAINEAYDNGLAKIKEIAEKRASEKVYDGFKINEITTEDMHFVMNRAEIKLENIQQFYQQNLGALFGKVQKAGVEMAGMPSGLFFKYDESAGATDMAAAIPVKEPIAIKDASSYTVPASRALQIDYYGDYANTAAAHYAMEKYMSDYGLLSNPPTIEQYVTDPTQEPDPTKWLTKITYFIAE